MGSYYFHDGETLLAAGTCPDGQEVLQPRPSDGAILVMGKPPCNLSALPRGHYWSMTQHKASPLAVPDDVKWLQVRYERDQRLAATDWRVVKAQEQGATPESVWVEYRQALRDITLQPDPANITWPPPPQT